MSRELLDFALKFAAGEICASEFADPFMNAWKRERDSGDGQADCDDLSERLSSIFCLADLYNPDENREDYELNESRLRREVDKIVKRGKS